MRLVLDTNVLLAGLLTRGVCEALLDACMSSDRCTIVLSEYILEEFARHARGKFGAPDADVLRSLDFLRRRCEIVEPATIPREVCGDRDDLPVLGTAVAGKADALVTRDAALLKLGRIDEVPIVSPRALYDAMR